MMPDQQSTGTPVVVATFFIAAWLQVLPLPEVLDMGRPEWISLVLIYWVIALPHRIGVLWGFAVGLFQDVLTGAVLGQHALAMALVAWIALSAYKRIRVFPPLQQSVVIFLLIGSGSLVAYTIQDATGRALLAPAWVLLPALISALIWRPAFGLLRYVRRTFMVR